MAPAPVLDVVRRDPPGATVCLRRDTPDHQFVLEHARGALMLRYGIDSCQALAVLVHWSAASSASLDVVAHTLVHAICEGNPQTAARQRLLVRWLEQQMCHHNLDQVLSTSPRSLGATDSPGRWGPQTSAVGGPRTGGAAGG